MDETCEWNRIKDLIWQTSCNHQVGTARSWEPVPDMACFCCHKPIEVKNDAGRISKKEHEEDPR